jgi:two-component system sensor histidine kinase TctE
MPPEPPLLRRQLLGWLLAPLVLLLTADTFVSYWVALSFSQRAHDRTLLEVAREFSFYLRTADGALALQMPEEARRLLFTDPQDRLYFEAAAGDGRAVAGERIAAAPAGVRQGAEAFYDGEVQGEAVRVIELRLPADAASGRPAALVRVAETKNKRNALAREILASVVLPQLLLIAIAGAVVWLGVVRGLRPLARLQRAVAARSHRDRSPLSAEGVPGEVSPLLAAMNDLLARLDRALTLQGRFIADAAHQLKTPIAALRAQYEVALREPDAARMREALRQLEPGLDRLSRLVQQLLSLARNEPEGAPVLRLAPLDLNALALEAATAWVPQALRKGIDLGFEGAAEAVPIRGDGARLRELLDNLLDNAVRYSREGGRVTVRVQAEPVVAVHVNDDGPSIPAAERSRVFERFHRLLGSGQEGSGLGLAIAQEIARLHGAEIGLQEDADGVGNTFSVSFPKAA